MVRLARALGARVHYAWIALGITFLTLLVAVAVRATPSVLIVPLEQAFGWSRATISAAISLNLLLFGALGPFGAATMQRFGVRRTVLGALIVVGVAVAASTLMSASWQMVVIWGLVAGAGCGMIGPAFGPTVVNRWFSARRGMAMGVVTGSSAAGQLLFLPLLAAIAETVGWRATVLVMAGAVAALVPLIALLLPERPADLGLAPYGDSGAAAPAVARANPIVAAFSVLGRCGKSNDFWLLFASFFICGASSSGLIGSHLIAFCFDHGIPEVTAAGLLAGIGAFNIAGTALSGWLSDRYDNRVLLMIFFGLRGLSLFYLPYSDFSFYTLSIFAMFYGLDWLATAPPILRLLNDNFGREDAPVIFGWVFAGHQVGASAIALLGGVLRTDLGSYVVPFMISGTLCLVAAIFVRWIGTAPDISPSALAPADGAS